jgi:hypothetical protein
VTVLKVYLRVIALLGPERKLAVLLVAANLALAAILLLEPWLLFAQLNNQGQFLADAVENAAATQQASNK